MIRSGALAFVLTAALVGGCDGKSPRRMLLVGGWAPPGQACDSRDGVVYDKAGSWAGYNVAGRWTLDGRHLTTRVTERGGFDRPAHTVSGEKPSRATILSLTETDLILQSQDGSTQSLKRCRP